MPMLREVRARSKRMRTAVAYSSVIRQTLQTCLLYRSLCNVPLLPLQSSLLREPQSLSISLFHDIRAGINIISRSIEYSHLHTSHIISQQELHQERSHVQKEATDQASGSHPFVGPKKDSGQHHLHLWSPNTGQTGCKR